MEEELVSIVTSFREGAPGTTVKECLNFLKKYGPQDRQAHQRLCSAMLSQAGSGNSDMRSVLHYAGAAEVFNVVYSNIAHTKLTTAKWLCSEVHSLLRSGGVSSILTTQAKLGAPVAGPKSLQSSQQQQLVSAICRLPDVLANRLGQQLREALLPVPYFKAIGEDFRDSLTRIHSHMEGDEVKVSLEFHGAMLGRAATLGYHSAMLESLLPFLEQRAYTDQSWSRLSQAMISHVPVTSLEPVLEALVGNCSPSLLPSSPLAALIGRDILSNHKAKLVLSHKLILVRVPSSPASLHNLLGYLAGSESGRELMSKSLQSALGVWSDAMAIRHMAVKQHLWISRVLALGVTLLAGHKEWEVRRTDFLKVLMTGIQVHIQSPLPEVRHVGMAVGQTLMNLLHPTTKESNRLKFDYEPSPDTASIERLARPLEEQEKELRETWPVTADGGVVTSVGGFVESKENPDARVSSKSVPSRVRSRSSSSSSASDTPPRQFGEGLVRAVDCSDSDSDDDLVPYAMDDDPDATEQAPPRYLRTLMQDLLSTKEPQKIEVGLRAAEGLVRSKPSDLREVCMELTKILLHLSDDYCMEDFSRCRHCAMVALSTLCPDLVTPYLTQEFYSPNYTLRHRMDVLEVIAAAALELSSPASSPSSSSSSSSASPPLQTTSWLSRKPWEDIIEQRLKTKTRIISKGPRQPAPQPVANKFSGVAPLFFFPLMNRFDQPMNTLDLLGEDGLVLGNLLYTLGTVMYAAANLPIVAAMGAAFLDFLWALRYHCDAYVRHGVLYGMGMLLWATPNHILLGDLSMGVAESVSWMKEVAENDPDLKSRTLAAHALSILSTIK